MFNLTHDEWINIEESVKKTYSAARFYKHDENVFPQKCIFEWKK